MEPDDHICYCYHVSLRKLENFARRTRPQHASQMSQCLGAGSGCGWCIPFLQKIHTKYVQHDVDEASVVDMTPEEYAAARAAYRDSAQPKNTF